jgi:hypothetical protein
MTSQQFLTLRDLAARRGTDAAVGLVEQVVTYAPEVEKIMGRPIPGTSYNARIRAQLTAGTVFRKTNSGVVPGASSYDERRFNTYFLDSQLQVDEATARAAEQEGDSLALLQAEEAEGAIRAKAIGLGKQLYAGTLNDPLGFPGLLNYIDAFSTVIDSRTGLGIDLAVGAGSTSSTLAQIVWYIWMHQQGVHFLWGANQGVDIKPWKLQYVQDQNDPTKRLLAWVTNLSGFIGLSAANPYSIGAIMNVESDLTSSSAAAHPWTDAQDAKLWAKFPVGMKPNLVLASRSAVASLQASRTVTMFGQMMNRTSENSGAAAPIAPWPTATATGNIPIVVTDSILPGAYIPTIP